MFADSCEEENGGQWVVWVLVSLYPLRRLLQVPVPSITGKILETAFPGSQLSELW